MHKFILPMILITAIIFLPSTKAYAYDEPIAGMSEVLSEAEENPTELHIAYYSAIYEVDSGLVEAVIECESHGQTNAHHVNKNGSHDSGLMQVNSCNHKWLRKELGITDFYDTQQNIQSGVYILGLLSSKYKSIDRVLMSYNMGESRTSRLWKRGVRSSQYSRKVVKKMKEVN